LALFKPSETDKGDTLAKLNQNPKVFPHPHKGRLAIVMINSAI